MMHPSLLNSLKIARSFSQSASTYDEVAVLQQEIGCRLLERLDLIRIMPERIIDLGSGTGHFTQRLEKRYKKALVYGIDSALGMLHFAKQKTQWLTRERFIGANAVNLPFKTQSIDFVFSNLTLHWCVDLKQVFQEVYRVLKPGGFFIFSMTGVDTLKELRDCWSKVDNYAHVNSFVDMHHVGDLLLQTGWSDPVMDMEYMTMEYSNVRKLIDDLRKLGAHNNFADKRKTLTGKGHFQKMVQYYEDYRQEGLLPATYEIIYGHAWRMPKPEVSSIQEVSIPIEKIRR